MILKEKLQGRQVVNPNSRLEEGDREEEGGSMSPDLRQHRSQLLVGQAASWQGGRLRDE